MTVRLCQARSLVVVRYPVVVPDAEPECVWFRSAEEGTVDRGRSAGRVIPRSFDPSIGIATGNNDTVSFTIEAGAAIIYGATTDNISQDPSLQLARSSW